MLCFLPCFATVVVAAAAAANRTLLLVDDHELLYRAGLERVLEPLRRPTPGVPALGPTKPWEDLLGYVSVQEVEGRLMMWYQSYTTSHSDSINGSGCFVAVAYSVR
eukprot:SAG11_NODE_1780_length_4264_cov_3.335654_3_plen_106_part_00